MAAPSDFKDAEAVAEFLKNLGIEYRFSCYSEKDPKGCHLLGDFVEAVEKNAEKARRVYKDNCESHKFGQSCYKYGKYLLLGQGGPKAKFPEVYRYFQTGCDNGCGDACLQAGLIYGSGYVDGKKDKKCALQYFEKGCDLDCTKSCYQASGLYIKGSDEVPKDMKKAFQLSLKACDKENAYACQNLSLMYKSGKGVTKDLNAAARYQKIALDIQEAHKKTQNTIKFSE